MISAETGYAAALAKASITIGNVARVLDDLEAIEKVLAAHSRYFYNPRIKASEKAETLFSVFENSADALSVQFAALLAQRRKLKYFPGVKRQFAKMAASALRQSAVRIYLPYPMKEEMLEKLKDHLAEIGLYAGGSGSSVTVDIVYDESLIGGFIAESGGRRLDMSLKTRLARLSHA